MYAFYFVFDIYVMYCSVCHIIYNCLQDIVSGHPVLLLLLKMFRCSVVLEVMEQQTCAVFSSASFVHQGRAGACAAIYAVEMVQSIRRRGVPSRWLRAYDEHLSALTAGAVLRHSTPQCTHTHTHAIVVPHGDPPHNCMCRLPFIRPSVRLCC